MHLPTAARVCPQLPSSADEKSITPLFPSNSQHGKYCIIRVYPLKAVFAPLALYSSGIFISAFNAAGNPVTYNRRICDL